MIGLILIFLVLMCMVYASSESGTTSNYDDKTDSGNYSSKEDVWNRMGRAKCKCLTCNQTVYIPTQYLERRYGVQNSKCPNCDWKIRKVKIIQTWGIE